MNFVNCTNHNIKVYNNGELVLNLSPASSSARVRQRHTDVEEFNKVPIATKLITKVENLPDPKPNTLHIVSGFLKNAVSDRSDLVSPDTGADSRIEDEEGNIIGVERLTF